jgi:hypothetical protein
MGILPPRLVAQAHELWNQLDAVPAAGSQESLGAGFGNRPISLAQFGVRLKLESVVDFEDQAIDAHFAELRKLLCELV